MEAVALLAGAWIETSKLIYCKYGYLVALLAGAWIETISGIVGITEVKSRPPCGGVD